MAVTATERQLHSVIRETFYFSHHEAFGENLHDLSIEDLRFNLIMEGFSCEVGKDKGNFRHEKIGGLSY